MRGMLREFAASRKLLPRGSVYAEDQMDDGSPVCLRVTIDGESGDAEFDFAGTGALELGAWCWVPCGEASIWFVPLGI